MVRGLEPMTAIAQWGYSPAAGWSRRLGAFSAALFLTSGLSHRFGLVETVPFFWLLGITFLVAVSALGLAVVGFVQFWEHGLAGLKSAGLGALLSALVLAPYAVAGYRYAVHPRLTDVSTDISRPPQFQKAAGLRVPPMNPLRPASQEARLLQVEAYPELVGRRYEHPGEQVTQAVIDLMTDRRWQILTQQPGGGLYGVTMEAVAHSYFLGFPSDVAVRIEERANATFVDLRSVSRYGRHGLGDNFLRIRRFLDDLDRRLEGTEGR